MCPSAAALISTEKMGCAGVQDCACSRWMIDFVLAHLVEKRERERERERTRKEGGKEERQRNGRENDWSGSLSWSVKIRFERGGPAEQKNPSLAQWSSTSIDVQGRLLLLLDPATVPLLIELSYSDMLYCFCQTKSPLTLSSTPLSLGFLERQPLFTDIYVPFFFKCRSLSLSLSNLSITISSFDKSQKCRQDSLCLVFSTELALEMNSREGEELVDQLASKCGQ